MRNLQKKCCFITKILMSALSHEIRNVSAAMNLVYRNFMRTTEHARNKELVAMGALLQTLETIANTDVKHTHGNVSERVDIHSLLEDLRIIIESAFSEANVTIQWNIPEELPHVFADRQRLLQVLLNLCKNSDRAMQQAATKQLILSACVERNRLIIRIRDSGCGVANPDRLFQPFQLGAVESGLGLYISRAFVRAFQGELRYEPGSAGEGACFAIILVPVTDTDELHGVHQSIAVGAGGYSHS